MSSHFFSKKNIIPLIILASIWWIWWFFIDAVWIPVGFERLNPTMILLIAASSFIPYILKYGIKWAYILLMLWVTGFVIEFIAIKTCVPYWCFVYSDLLGFLVLDTVPWTVLFARSPLVLWLHAICKQYTLSHWQRYVVWAVLLVLCDMVLDPWAVSLWFWIFEWQHWYYNVPWVNFLWRLVTGCIGMREIDQRERRYYKKTKKSIWHDVTHTFAMRAMIVFWTTYAWFFGQLFPFLLGIWLLSGYLLFLLKKSILHIFLVSFGVAVFWLGCIWMTYPFRINYAYQQQIFDDINTVPSYQVWLVLWTSKYALDGRLNLFWKYRMDAVIALFAAWKIQYILVSWDNSIIEYNEPQQIQQELIQRGIPEDRIVLDFAWLRTLDSVFRAKQIFGVDHMLVISQTFHVQRSLALCESIGLVCSWFTARDVPTSIAPKVYIREYFARVLLYWDLFLRMQKPRYLGEVENVPWN